MITRSSLDALLQRADALIASVRFDNSGSIVGGQYMGGNGGLLSHDTEKAANELETLVAQVRQLYPAASSERQAMLGEITGLMGEVLAEMQYRGNAADLRLFIDRFCAKWKG